MPVDKINLLIYSKCCTDLSSICLKSVLKTLGNGISRLPTFLESFMNRVLSLLLVSGLLLSNNSYAEQLETAASEKQHVQSQSLSFKQKCLLAGSTLATALVVGGLIAVCHYTKPMLEGNERHGNAIKIDKPDTLSFSSLPDEIREYILEYALAVQEAPELKNFQEYFEDITSLADLEKFEFLKIQNIQCNLINRASCCLVNDLITRYRRNIKDEAKQSIQQKKEELWTNIHQEIEALTTAVNIAGQARHLRAIEHLRGTRKKDNIYIDLLIIKANIFNIFRKTI
jgi:hypothetical protein